ncbi:histidinol dehydrogenase [Candidatus Pyrohabitans sp.]
MLFSEIVRLTPAQKDRLLRRGRADLSKVEAKVARIIDEVRSQGDAALRELTRRFDGVDVEELRVSEEEIKEARRRVEGKLIEALELAKQNIAEFHQRQLREEWKYARDGITLGQIFRAITSVGCYVPGGRASYPSTVLMCALPAKVAGVRRVVVTTPPMKSGEVNPLTLAACSIAGVDEVYRVGGAQAIAALAYGTESIARVEKIIGPGNVYVTAAKRLVSAEVAIDMPAGPSEVLIIADDSADAYFIALDMLAQAEHDPLASSVLVTTSLELAGRVKEMLEELKPARAEAKQAIEANGAILVARDIDEAVEFANMFAPEHLQIVIRDDESVLRRINSAGSVFLGSYSPVACGDYASGTNHVLPTSGYARAYSGLNIYDFIKVISFQRLSREALERLAEAIVPLARAEGLEMHAKSVEERLTRREHD